MKKTYTAFGKALLVIFIGWAAMAANTKTPAPDADLDRLISYMQGDFASTGQSQRDSAYFDIRLHMARIWADRKDGYWLYVEQAMSTAQDKPYRQRVYHVHRIDASTLISEVFTLHKPLRFAGGYKDASLLKGLHRDSLIHKEGCGIKLAQKDGRHFAGQTGDRTCPSDLRGAAFATSAVTVGPDTLLSWDRGFDKEGKQVWGAVKGGYEFVKQK